MAVITDTDVRVATIAVVTHSELTNLSSQGKLPTGVPLYVIDKGIILVSDGTTPLTILYENAVQKLKATLGI